MPNSNSTPIASPLTIIRRAAGVDRRSGAESQEYEEALFLSYTIDFGFLDSVAVPLLRSTGARVTAVGDITMANFDVQSARRAGREFNAAYAQCAGAFHPKLFVLASETLAHIAIGSGNATMAGWAYNAELWTVISCTQNDGSPVALELASWLDGLANAVRFSAGVGDRLTSVASLLRGLSNSHGASDTHPRLVSSLISPIIGQLPEGPVDELSVYAPFFDPGAVGLKKLIDRLQPAAVEVAVQPSLSQFDGSALLAAISSRDYRILSDKEDRYRHGKLIEWCRGNRRWALTGSANISVAALLKGMADGGNCELGLLTEISESLMPEACEELSKDQVRSISAPPRRPEANSGPLLLGAHRSERGIQIALTTALPDSGSVQHIELDGDEWHELTVSAVDERTLVTSEPLAPGSRIRLRTWSSGSVQFSNIVAVTELATTAARRLIGAMSSPKYDLKQLFSPRMLERLLGDLQDLRNDLKSAGINTSSAGLQRDTPEAAAEIQTFEAKIGLPVLNFSIGVDSRNEDVEREGHLEDEESQGDVEYAEDEEDDSSNLTGEQSGDTDPIERLSHSEEQTRARYRKWAEKATDQMTTLSTTGCLAITRIVLWLMSSGVWGRDDEGACNSLTKALGVLGSAAPTAELEPQVGSLAAVCAAILRRKVPTQRGTPEALLLVKTLSEVAYLLPAAEINVVDNYLHYLAEPTATENLGFSIEAEEVMEVAARLLARDDVADAMELLIADGFEVSRPFPRVMHVRADSRRPELIALQALSYADTDELTAAWCATPHDRWSLVLWRRPDFIVVNGSGNDNPLWSHFHTHLDLRVIRQAERSGSVEKRFGMAKEIHYGARIVPIELGIRMMAELGLDSPEP